MRFKNDVWWYSTRISFQYVCLDLTDSVQCTVRTKASMTTSRSTIYMNSNSMFNIIMIYTSTKPTLNAIAWSCETLIIIIVNGKCSEAFWMYKLEDFVPFYKNNIHNTRCLSNKIHNGWIFFYNFNTTFYKPFYIFIAANLVLIRNRKTCVKF